MAMTYSLVTHTQSDGGTDAVSHAANSPNSAQGSSPNARPPKRPQPSWMIWLLRLIVAALVAVMILLLALFYMAGTDQGTKFLVEKIALETGTTLTYGEGNLRDGLWVSDVKIAQGENITVSINRAYIEMGWRAVLARQVHLVNADIDTVEVINKKPPTGEPFDYATISLPVDIRLENSSVRQVRYLQATAEPVVLSDIHIQSGTWAGEKITLEDSKLRYGDVLDVSRATGEIELSGQYPLNLNADVHIHALDSVYFDTLSVKATGTLKRTVGTLSSKYNQSAVTGSFIAQGLDENSPFSARLDFDKVLLPYAEEQHITLSNGTIIADGVVSNIELRINTDLSAKDIPSGRYRGRGIVRDGGMDIPYLHADTPNGALTATGKMEWSDEYELDATIAGNGFDVRAAMLAEYRDYQAYLPKSLDGTLGVKYRLLDTTNNETRFEFDLAQKDGEIVRATLRQNQSSPDMPWLIDANWLNFKRSDVPQIGVIDSRIGQASLRLEEGRTFITADANINALNAAPAGHYVLAANIDKGERVYLTGFDYQGVIGKLRGTGQLDFATMTKPMTWQIDAIAEPIKPNAYFDTPEQTPFDTVTGRVVARGIMRDDGKNSLHDITITDSDLTAVMTTGETVQLSGAGTSQLVLNGSEITALRADFDGQLTQAYLPQLGKTDIGVSVAGDLNKLSFSRATLVNDQGKVSIAGDVGLRDGISWDIKGRLDEVNTKALVTDQSLAAIISGDVASRGVYRNETLADVALSFDGQVINDKLPAGTLAFDATGKNNRFEIKRLHHDGDAGRIDATGWLDLNNGAAWALDADMAALDLGAFVQGIDSDMTGKVRLSGDWGSVRQIVQIENLAITGAFNGRPLSATGSLYAELALPKDIQGYIDRIKQTSRRPRTREELISLRNRIDNNARQTQNIIRKLDANNLKVQIGENYVAMNGDESQLTTSVNIVDLSQIINQAAGRIQGGVILINDDNALPTLYIDVSAAQVRAPSLVIQNAQAIGKINNLGNSPSQLLMQGNDIIVMGKVIKSARLDFSGTESDHLLSVETQSGDIEAASQVHGSFDRETMTYTGVLDDSHITSRFGTMVQRQPAEFRYGLNDGALKVAAHCWQSAHIADDGVGVLCLQDTLSYTPTSGNVNVVIQNLDTQVFSAALPSDIEWQSMLNGHAKASWRQGTEPVVDAVLYSDDGRLGLTQEDTGYVEMPYKRFSIIAQSVAKGLKIRTDVTGTAGKGYADIVINPYQENKPISGALVMDDLNLAVLRPFFPSIQTLTGKVALAGGLGGTLSKPLFFGNANLDNGALSIAGVPLPLTDINAVMNIRGTNATLEGSFKGGDGTGKLDGALDWADEVQAKLGISGEKLSIAQPPLVVAQIDPDLEIIVKPLSKYVDVQGVVSIPVATLRPPETTADIVSESPDVTVLDRRITGNVEQILAVVEPWNINANIGVDLGSQVEFRGLGATLPLAGALHLTQSGQGAMQALGVVQVSKRTKIDGIGQNLELNYAQIRFNGDMLNPYLSIEGEKEIEGQTIGVRIRGTANEPDITVFNDAGLTEQQAMNALVTGRINETTDSQITEQGFRSQVTNQLAAAGLSLGLSGTRNLTNQIGQALGLQSLTVDASGSASDTNVNVTGYITPDLYIRYGVGVFNAESSLSMRYQLTRRVYIEATSAAENMVDVIYRWKF